MPFDQDVQLPYEHRNSIPDSHHAYAMNMGLNRNALITRIASDAMVNQAVKLHGFPYRPMMFTLAAAVADNVVATITVAPAIAEGLQTADVLELVSGEHVLITGINTGTGVLNVIRGFAGSIGAAQANGSVVRLIGTAETGGAVDKIGTTAIASQIDQYAQVWQNSVQVGGSLQSARNYVLPPGTSSVLDMNKKQKLQEMLDDCSRATYYGLGASRSATNKNPTQKGIRQLISTNKVTVPVNAGAYKPSDFSRDVIEPIFAAGGNPQWCFIAPSWQGILLTWGIPPTLLNIDSTTIGSRIKAFAVPGLAGDVTFVFDPMLKPGSACCLSNVEGEGPEVWFGWLREIDYYERGRRGDAVEGDYISEGAIHLVNENHHAWLEGVTAGAKQS